MGLATQALKAERFVDLTDSAGPWIHEQGAWSDTSSETSSEDSTGNGEPAVSGAAPRQVFLDDESVNGQESHSGYT